MRKCPYRADARHVPLATSPAATSVTSSRGRQLLLGLVLPLAVAMLPKIRRRREDVFV